MQSPYIGRDIAISQAQARESSLISVGKGGGGELKEAHPDPLTMRLSLWPAFTHIGKRTRVFATLKRSVAF